jgi:hypothetical protein
MIHPIQVEMDDIWSEWPGDGDDDDEEEEDNVMVVVVVPWWIWAFGQHWKYAWQGRDRAFTYACIVFICILVVVVSAAMQWWTVFCAFLALWILLLVIFALEVRGYGPFMTLYKRQSDKTRLLAKLYEVPSARFPACIVRLEELK